MKTNFRKITAIATSVLLAGMSVGMAAAANYPAPFVSGGSANVAIVYGTGEGVSTLDAVQAGNIQADLQSFMGGSTSTSSTNVEGGDYVKLERTATKWNLGDAITDIVSTTISANSPNSGLPTLLANGKYVDSDNDEFDFTQKIELDMDATVLNLTMFDSNDFKEKTPTIGIAINKKDHLLNYTLDFTDKPLWADVTSTTLNILGKEYFVLSYTVNTTLNLLDSANTAIVGEGETITTTAGANTYEVSIQYISSTEVKLAINGETTNSLQEAQTQKLSDGAYIGIKDIMHDSKTGSVSSVEFSLGTGKLVLKHNTAVEINDESISNLKTYFTSASSTSGTQIDDLVIEWKAQKNQFLTPESEILMPGFKAIKFTMGEMIYPHEEVIEIIQDGDNSIVLNDFPLKESVEDINIIYGNNSNWAGIGKDDDNQLRTSKESSIVFDEDTDDYFIASYNDGTNAESYLITVTDFKEEDSGSTNKTTFNYAKGGDGGITNWEKIQSDITFTAGNPSTDISIGSISLTVRAVDVDLGTVNISAGTSVDFNRLYSKEGLQIYLPYADILAINTGALNTTHNMSTTFDLLVVEEDNNGNVGAGAKNITVQLGWDSSSTKEAEVSDISGESATFGEIQETDIYRSFVYTELGTEILWAKPSGGQKSVELIYHGDESYGEIYLSTPDATVTGGTTTGGSTQLGEVIVKDNEVSSVSTKNLVIVGGSCINSAAAKILGGAYCGSAFTDATGVGSGQFLIKGVSDVYTSGKLALVVAGYEAADTVAATKYLTTQTVDTGKAYKGTSATSAEQQRGKRGS